MDFQLTGKLPSTLADLLEQRIPLIVALMVHWRSRSAEKAFVDSASVGLHTSHLARAQPEQFTPGPSARHGQPALFGYSSSASFFSLPVDSFHQYWNDCQRKTSRQGSKVQQVSPSGPGRAWFNGTETGLEFLFQGGLWSNFRTSVTGRGLRCPGQHPQGIESQPAFRALPPSQFLGLFHVSVSFRCLLTGRLPRQAPSISRADKQPGSLADFTAHVGISILDASTRGPGRWPLELWTSREPTLSRRKKNSVEC